MMTSLQRRPSPLRIRSRHDLNGLLTQVSESWECCGGNGSLRIPIITITGLRGAPHFRRFSETQLSEGHVRGNVACPRPTYQPD